MPANAAVARLSLHHDPKSGTQDFRTDEVYGMLPGTTGPQPFDVGDAAYMDVDQYTPSSFMADMTGWGEFDSLVSGL